MATAKLHLEAITPKMPNYPDLFMLASRRAVDVVRVGIEDDLNKITRTWSTKVKWKTRIDTSGGNLAVEVSTTNAVFGYLEHGTGLYGPKHRAYPIPKPGNTKAKILRFQAGYKPKTKPGVLESGSGGPFGETVFRHTVMHPGVEARNWIPALAKKHQKSFTDIARAEYKKVAVKK